MEHERDARREPLRVRELGPLRRRARGQLRAHHVREIYAGLLEDCAVAQHAALAAAAFRALPAVAAKARSAVRLLRSRCRCCPEVRAGRTSTAGTSGAEGAMTTSSSVCASPLPSSSSAGVFAGVFALLRRGFRRASLRGRAFAAARLARSSRPSQPRAGFSAARLSARRLRGRRRLLREAAEAALAALRRGRDQLLALVQRQRLRLAILGDLRVLRAIGDVRTVAAVQHLDAGVREIDDDAVRVQHFLRAGSARARAAARPCTDRRP